jgi:hypothetical protein
MFTLYWSVRPFGAAMLLACKVGRCRLSVLKPGLKARLISALETEVW